MTAMLAVMRMEARLQWSRPFLWFALAASFALAFAATAQNGLGVHGLSWVNGGDAIATRALLLSVLGILVAAGIVGDAMSRDRDHGTEETLLATGIGRLELGLGRFTVAALSVVVVGAMFVPGMILGTLVPGIPEDRIGPLRLSHYAKALAIYVIPNLLLVSALVYAVAGRWKSRSAAFVVAVGLIALYATMLMLLGQDVYRQDRFGLYAMLDPYGTIASGEHAMTWTVTQNNLRFRPFDGLLLWNRAIWAAVTVTLLALGTFGQPTVLRHAAPGRSRARTIGWRPVRSDRAFFRTLSWELTALWRQPGVRLLLIAAAFSLWWAAASAVTYEFSLPTTDLLIHNAGFYFDKVLVLLVVWAAADIMWRERQHGVDQLMDTLPDADHWRFLAKTAALILIVLLFWTISIVVGALYQVAHGFFDFEWDLYVLDTFVFKAPYYVWLAVLAIAAQVLLRQRYVAMALVLLVHLTPSLFDALGLFHPLYRFGDTGFFWFSPMNGFGHFWAGHLWMLAWWTAVSSVIWLVAWGCYARGTEPGAREDRLRRRLARGRGAVVFGTALAVTVTLGGAILWQSTVLHRWPLFDVNQAMADVERGYRAEWGDVPQPRIVGITGEIGIFPDARRIAMTGEVVLENMSDADVPELILFFHPLLSRTDVEIAGATEDGPRSQPHAQIWTLDKPLSPGGQVVVNFRTGYAPDPGFALHNPNDRVPEVQPVEVLGNGTSLMNLNLMPAPGYSERLEHKPLWLRRLYGLEGAWSPPPSAISAEVPHDTTHLGWVRSMDVTVTTDADQTPLYPGVVMSDVTEDGRRRIRYRTDGPSRGWAEVMSARYDRVLAGRPGLPTVELYHHPSHDYTLAPLSNALTEAMAYFEAHYGPPPFKVFRMAETALLNDGFGQRGGLAYVSETLGWKTDLAASGGEDIRRIASDLMGLAWWLDQIQPANLPGAKAVWSGLPYWTSALHLHGQRGPALSREQRIQEMLEMYRARAALEDVERPFAEEMKNSTMLRRKGALHIVYLAELAGQARLEAAFAGFLDAWRYRGPPYPSAEDLIRHLESALPSVADQALNDFFRHITNWRLRAVEAEAMPTDDGWRVIATVETGKLRTGDDGVESPARFDTVVPLTVFGGDGFGQDDTILTEWRTLPGGRSVIEMTVPTRPLRFGIDAHAFLPDSNPYDNVVDVRIAGN